MKANYNSKIIYRRQTKKSICKLQAFCVKSSFTDRHKKKHDLVQCQNIGVQNVCGIQEDKFEINFQHVQLKMQTKSLFLWKHLVKDFGNVVTKLLTK